jgi:hypothetical protein
MPDDAAVTCPETLERLAVRAELEVAGDVLVFHS